MNKLLVAVAAVLWYYHWQWKFELKFVESAIEFLSYFVKMIDGPRKTTQSCVPLMWVELVAVVYLHVPYTLRLG